MYTIASSARQNIDHVGTINTKLPMLIVRVLSIKANVIVRTNIVVRKDVNIISNVYLATESNQSDKLLDCGEVEMNAWNQTNNVKNKTVLLPSLTMVTRLKRSSLYL